MSAASVIDVEKDADLVGAFVILPDVFEVKALALLRFVLSGVLGETDEHFTPLSFWQMFEEFEDLFEFLGKVAHSSIKGFVRRGRRPCYPTLSSYHRSS